MSKNLIKIKVLSTTYKTKDGKRTFKKFFTPVNIVVEGEEEKGMQAKTVDVKFTGACKEQKVGIYEGIAGDDISLPRKFKITVNEDGKKEYPICWVRGYSSIKPLPYKNDSCVPVVDDEESESTDDIEIE